MSPSTSLIPLNPNWKLMVVAKGLLGPATPVGTMQTHRLARASHIVPPLSAVKLHMNKAEAAGCAEGTKKRLETMATSLATPTVYTIHNHMHQSITSGTVVSQSSSNWVTYFLHKTAECIYTVWDNWLCLYSCCMKKHLNTACTFLCPLPGSHRQTNEISCLAVDQVTDCHPRP